MTPQNLLPDLLPQAVWQALGWTLLHSLWQGTLVALVLAGLLGLMSRHSAATRYRVACAGLLAMLLLSALTFYQLYEPSAPAAMAEYESIAPHLDAEALAFVTVETTGFWQNAWAQGQAYFNQHLPVVILLWFLGMLIMGLRMVGGWVYVQRLKTYRTQLVPAQWQQKARHLARQLGLKKAVAVAESALVQVPLVVGHFKPMVLLPLGTLAGLSAPQLEAILAHELAHVLRKDYLINLLQSLVETVFFFHPAVWWLSDCIRTEREHATDDLALSVCGNSLTYAYALTTLAEMNLNRQTSPPRLSMAFWGQRRSLLGRIARLVQKPALHPSFAEGFLASCAVMAGILVFSVSAWANADARAELPAYAFSGNYPEEQAIAGGEEGVGLLEEPAEETYTLQTLDDGLIIVQNKKGKVVEVYVNGRRIPKSELGPYQERIARQLAAAKQGKPLRNRQEVEAALAQTDATLENLRAEEALDLMPDAPPAPPAPDAPDVPLPGMPMMSEAPSAPDAPLSSKRLRAPVPPVPPTPPTYTEKNKRRSKEEIEKYDARLKEYEAKMEQYHERQEEFHARLEAARANRQEDQELRETAHALRMKVQEKRLAEHAVRMKDHEKRMAEHKLRMEKHEAVMKELKSELLKDKLISAADTPFDFKINQNGLFINDQKQPDRLYEKYKKLISKTSGNDMEIEMRKEGSSYTISTKE